MIPSSIIMEYVIPMACAAVIRLQISARVLCGSLSHTERGADG
ncbi:unnamed protein product [Acidocella sp. C78]|nr:unnamed protein product [Acidocella sp. C78]